jgi:serine/threonine protein phosphatase PrpC
MNAKLQSAGAALALILFCAPGSSADPPAKDEMYGTTWMGLKTQLNQDNMELRPKTGVFAVTDGEGPAGEVAASFAAKFLANFLSDPGSVQDPEHLESETLRYAVDYTGEEVAKVRAMKPDFKDASCSLGLLWLRGKHAWFARAGDVQLYRLHQGKLESVFGPYKKKSESLHGQKTVKAETRKLKTRPGEVYALCTDGVYQVLDKKQLEEILLHSLGNSLESTAKQLAEAVDKKGSPDNFTLVLVRNPG